jgi:hypothetical protein
MVDDIACSFERGHNCTRFTDYYERFTDNRFFANRSFFVHRGFLRFPGNGKPRSEHRRKSWNRRWYSSGCDTTCRHRIPRNED